MEVNLKNSQYGKILSWGPLGDKQNSRRLNSHEGKKKCKVDKASVTCKQRL